MVNTRQEYGILWSKYKEVYGVDLKEMQKEDYESNLHSSSLIKYALTNNTYNNNVKKLLSLESFTPEFIAEVNNKSFDLREHYYIYLHLNIKGEIIYVGLTKNLKARQCDHLHVSSHKEHIHTIKYAEVPNETTMIIYEIYYINKFAPKYNLKHNRGEVVEGVTELIFKPYTHTFLNNLK